MTIQEVLSTKSILIGSRGFNVHTNDSDYDIVILKKDLPEKIGCILNGGASDSPYDISKYFNILPRGDAWVIPKFQCENNECVD